MPLVDPPVGSDARCAFKRSRRIILQGDMHAGRQAAPTVLICSFLPIHSPFRGLAHLCFQLLFFISLPLTSIAKLAACFHSAASLALSAPR